MIRLVFILLCSISILNAEVVTNYTIRQADTSEQIVIRMDDTIGPKEIKYTSKYIQKWTLGNNGHTLLWIYQNVSENSYISIHSHKDYLSLSGRYRGRDVSSNVKVLDTPWIQYIDAYFPVNLFLNGITKFTYIRSRDLKPITLTIKQRISPNPQLYHFQAFISPLPAFLWRMDFWVDKSSYLIVKKRISGSPTLFMTKND